MSHRCFYFIKFWLSCRTFSCVCFSLNAFFANSCLNPWATIPPLPRHISSSLWSPLQSFIAANPTSLLLVHFLKSLLCCQRFVSFLRTTQIRGAEIVMTVSTFIFVKIKLSLHADAAVKQRLTHPESPADFDTERSWHGVHCDGLPISEMFLSKLILWAWKRNKGSSQGCMEWRKTAAVSGQLW